LEQQLEEAQRRDARQDAEIRRLRKKIQALTQQTHWQDSSRPADSPLKGHKYGRRLIRLAVNLARAVGLRASERVLRIIWEWLRVDC
jgi:hypothetical protein